MSKITILPDEVANHIAAGEVIERPASVVKELVENALDAEATQIDIEIGIGGKSYIRVTDNGSGMLPEDAQLAFERHATSKLASTADLASITTLGFRGEALPSIASVAKVKLLTRPIDAVAGTRVDIHGGDIISVSESGAAPGTFLEVSDLFYKTPARLKFLKSPATELGYITTVILEEALAHPNVGFTVKNNGREHMNLPGNSTLLQRIAGLFGRDLIRELVEVHESAGSLSLRGFIGLPTCHRANRNYQKIFVNMRPVKDKTIMHAIVQTYDNLIPKGRHPVAVLFLDLPPELVDVNVHPTKMEIRFVNSQSIHDLIVQALRKTLSTSGNIATLPALPANAPDTLRPPIISPEVEQTPQWSLSEELPFERWQQPAPEAEATIPGRNFNQGRPSPLAGQPAIPAFPTRQFITPQTSLRSGRFAAMKPIGQFHETYLLVQDGEELCIIDQHAAHERVYYERLKAQIQQGQLEVQALLFPVSLDVSPREQTALEEYRAALGQYGLEIEPFGGSTYLLKSVPALLAKADYKKLLFDLFDQLVDTEKTMPLDQIFDAILKLMACHAAIRAHQPLQQAQIFGLLQQMDTVEYPYTCPHGRPTIVKITAQDLAKTFERT